MALSSDEQADVYARVREIILRDFHEDFEDIWSYAVTVLELAPEQANNEIRNSLNHIARALIAESRQSANDNMLQAKGHIDRAKRDCVKLAVIHLHEQAESDMMSVELMEGAVPISIKKRFETIVTAGIAARRAEASGDGEVLDKYSNVMADLKEFRSDLRTKFVVPSKGHGQAARFFLHFRREIYGAVIGIIIAIAGHWIYDHSSDLWPKHSAPAANTLSTGAKQGGAQRPAKSTGTAPH